ncbi:ral guanine nucleotide dissociation stimulator-like 1 isoform X1 [Brienomyrus brachyistius]|uniref:ral guanine nucleotide dissociation stimulator-like 1 isoform X1 n=1 Tax=Brienomyrus brachyistius TaxID=42636 RepID=UPI0020B1E98B|nr:ral guanine nucleotide dissociation stimulator-like 1 isoform X1 [Brienomyrus brachyistius]
MSSCRWSTLPLARRGRGLWARVSQMRRRLCLDHQSCVDVQLEPRAGVWLRSFHFLDTDRYCLDPVQEWGEEREEGVVYGVTLRRDPVQPAPDTTDGQLSQGCAQQEVCKLRRLKATTLDRLVAELLDPSCQEPNYNHIFLSTYRAFTSTSTLVELLFQRDDVLSELYPDCQNSSMLPLIQTWLDEYSEDFWDPPQCSALRLLSAHLFQRPCFRRLAKRAKSLLRKFQEESNQQEKVLLGEEAEMLDVQGAEEMSLTWDNAEEQVDFMDFPVRDVAEELTRLDAELFEKVMPFQCLGCVWSQRDKKENLAPTIRATVAQFNTVTNRVITSLLCSPVGVTIPLASSPAQRARIIEKWICVAQECRQLKNLSSLRAILSALQSNAIYRLKKTWATVSREYIANFENLCDTFTDENCVLTSREIVVEDESQAVEDPSAPHQSPKICPPSMSAASGVVPYLGTYLTILTMLDTALPDTVEGGLINFEKRRREFEILSEIRQLQGTCSLYSLSPHPQIAAWLQDCELLSDQTSYELSQELEPPVDTYPSPPTSWAPRQFGKKLTSRLLTLGDGTNSKTHADQISVSSSGSSSSELDELSTPQLSPRGKSSPCPSHEDVEASLSATSDISLISGSQTDVSVSPSISMSQDPSPGSQAPTASQPVYNKQVADSCIVRVSVECGNNGNVYKSILLTSQDKTAQVIQRALEKHNLEGVDIHNFTLSQVLPEDKELCIPDKANVFYAMSTSANYDFILRRRWKSHLRPLEGAYSSGSLTTHHQAK